MKTIKRTTKEFQPASDGSHSAILADIVDLGLVQGKWGPQEKIRLVFIVDEQDGEGEPIRVVNTCTKTLHPKSRLTGHVNALMPGSRNVKDLVLDPETLVGKHCQLITEQSTNDQGRTYTNIKSALPLGKDSPKVSIPLNFVRQKDKAKSRELTMKTKSTTKQSQGRASKVNGDANIQGLELTDEDIEFPSDAA
jgi:hypothetical protein